MEGMAALPATVLLHFDPLAVVDLALGRYVVAPLALLACEGDLYTLVASHCSLFSLSLTSGS